LTRRIDDRQSTIVQPVGPQGVRPLLCPSGSGSEAPWC
jgi:hypothetical protein